MIQKGASGRIVSSCRAAALSLVVLAPAAFAQDIGHPGPSYAGAAGFPTRSKPQSKLWFNDGAWWGCLWSVVAQSFTIQRLDLDTQTWLDTGIEADDRPDSKSDCLWDGARLYIGSHRFTTAGGAAGHPLLVFRYAYDPLDEEYVLDPGFPVQIGDSSTETLVIDKDSAGTLWAMWVRDLRVWVAHTLANDLSWSVPVVHPRSTSDLSTDDICSVVHFQGDRIGVMWSDQVTDSYYFSVHQDGDPDTAWSAPEPNLVGLGDDHINLKAAADGRVFAALKTSSDQVRLLVRSTAGSWTGHTVAVAGDGWTRPIVLLDEDEDTVHVFATSPVIQGSIYTKQSPMDAPSFPPGIGTPVLLDADGPAYNDATSTKQPLGGSSGLVVLASHQPDERYGHHHDPLGGLQQVPPVALFDGHPLEGFAPHAVQFIDSSSGPPEQWFWTFGDGDTSTEQHPLHVYTQPGLFTVSLEVTNSLGSDELTLAQFVDVRSAPLSFVLEPLGDAYVRELSPDENYGSLDFLRVRDDPSSDYRSYLKFDVPGAAPVASARLRLFCTDGSPDGGTVALVEDDWAELTLTWNGLPSEIGGPLGGLGEVTVGEWVELDVSAHVNAGERVNFGLSSASSNSAFYSSREGLNPPELVVELASVPSGPRTRRGGVVTDLTPDGHVVGSTASAPTRSAPRESSLPRMEWGEWGGVLEREAGELRLSFRVDGSLEDVLETWEERLLEQGFTIRERRLERRGHEVRGILLALTNARGSASLELRRGGHDEVLGTLLALE